MFLLALGMTARLTRLINRDYITRQLRVWAINRFDEDHDIPYLLACAWCASVWIAGGVFTVAWFYGEHAGFQIPALALTASWLYATVATYTEAD